MKPIQVACRKLAGPLIRHSAASATRHFEGLKLRLIRKKLVEKVELRLESLREAEELAEERERHEKWIERRESERSLEDLRKEWVRRSQLHSRKPD